MGLDVATPVQRPDGEAVAIAKTNADRARAEIIARAFLGWLKLWGFLQFCDQFAICCAGEGDALSCFASIRALPTLPVYAAFT